MSNPFISSVPSILLLFALQEVIDISRPPTKQHPTPFVERVGKIDSGKEDDSTLGIEIRMATNK